MSEIKITKAPNGGVVNAIVSKSAAHRILIAAFLSGLDLTDRCDGLSDDISATKACLLNMGEAQSRGTAHCCEVPCGESGSTL